MNSKAKAIITLPIIILMVPLAFYGGKRVVERLWNKTAYTRNAKWEQILCQKKDELISQPWKDGRPLTVFAGDSHFEYNNWYDAFHGSVSVRNCGLSTAGIQDVTEIVRSLREPKIHDLVLHCGINNLGRGDPPGSCIDMYNDLLDSAISLRPERIIVMAVMPVRQSAVDSASIRVNERVHQFNALLEKLCIGRGVVFLNLKGTVATHNGGLKQEYTYDGLHLNKLGYSKIAPELHKILQSGR